MKYLLIIIFVITNSVFSQNLKFIESFGNFSSASSFDIDLKGNFYVADVNEQTITKIDSSGNEISSIGGYGWEAESFDEPVNIITNTLSVYVADKNNNRVQRFDKDLNFLSQFKGDGDNFGVEFAYPSCLAISNVGDLFILDSDNYRILKFNLTGEYLQNIGANDAGQFALSNPKYFSTDFEGNIFILDENKIIVLDQYGNGLFSYPLNFEVNKIRNYHNNILYIGKSELTIFNLKERKLVVKISEFQNLEENEIVDAKIVGQKLFILSSKNILKYKLLF